MGCFEQGDVTIASGIADIEGYEGSSPKSELGALHESIWRRWYLLQRSLGIAMLTDKGAAMCKNPFDVELVDGKPRVFFLPDEDEATLYVYEFVGELVHTPRTT